MNKVVKKQLILSIIFIIIAIGAFTYLGLNYEIVEDYLRGYLVGFGVALAGISIYILIRAVIAIKNPEKGKELENEINDERLNKINDSAMALTFRATLLIEAVVSIVCAFIGKYEVCKLIALVVSIQLTLYLIIYYIIKRKN